MWCIFFKFSFVTIILGACGVRGELGYVDGMITIRDDGNLTELTGHIIRKYAGHLHKVKDLYVINVPSLRRIAVEDLKRMPKLRTLYISDAPSLTHVQQLPPLSDLKTFRIINSGLVEVPDLSRVHEYNQDAFFHVLDLDLNHISRIPVQALRVRADQVSLNDNHIEEIAPFAFKSAKIAHLSLKGNPKLKVLDKDAFSEILILRHLDLSSTSITNLPTTGLQTLETLRIEKTPSLKLIPSIYYFPQLKKAELTHYLHCCAFSFPEIHDPALHELYLMKQRELVKNCEASTSEPATAALRRRRNIRDLSQHPSVAPTWNLLDTGQSSEESSSSSSEYASTESDTDYMSEESANGFIDGFHDDTLQLGPVNANCGNLTEKRRKVDCTPIPNALNPCEDVMGWPWLRGCVWLVVAAAVFGNCAVLMVLLANRADITVPRFLMCHLAFADLCTGLYLLLVAAKDLNSYGEYFNNAFDWQYGIGCKIAGFLSVFSGQLSVFTLTIVTLERWFAITYAIYLERRISLASATKIMVCGWMFAIVIAMLPLVGVSDYSSTSICLPVESENVVDTVYQGSLFLTNAVAWLTIVGCYVQIYRSLGGSNEMYGGKGAAAAAEQRIAKKMAVLIGIDLLCWAPVAFFGVTALAGVPLIDVSHGKVLLVFFYPLNACANPFLYAILTKQYRRDLMALIARRGWCGWAVEKYKTTATPPPTAHSHHSNPTSLLPLNPQVPVCTVNNKDGYAEIAL